jgi:hypothetical protein
MVLGHEVNVNINMPITQHIKMSSDVWTKEQMDGKPSPSL